VCMPFHWQESNIVCVHTAPLAGIKHCLCAHHSTGRNQTLSVCTPFHWQESNIVCMPFHWQESNFVCVHTAPLAGIKHCLCAHQTTGRNQTLSVCTPFHWQESNIVCLHTVPLAGIKHGLCTHRSTCRNKHFLCAHHSTGRNQTLSVCMPFHWQESNIVCVHAIQLAGIKHCLCAHHSTCQSQVLQNPTHSLYNLGVRDLNFAPL